MNGISRIYSAESFNVVLTLPSTKVISLLLLTASLAIVFSSSTSAQHTHPGQVVYQQRCAVCHANPADSRAPSFSKLQEMNAQALRFALTRGVMKASSSNIPEQELIQLIEFIADNTIVKSK